MEPDNKIIGSSPPHRLLALDGMRGIAAIIVMIFHYTKVSESHYWVLANGRVAVDLFFCISGFVLAYTYAEKLKNGMPFLAFVKRRFVRLFPMHFLGVIMGAAMLLAATQTTLSSGALALSSLLNMAWLPYLNADSITTFAVTDTGYIFPSNPSLWSLFFEWFANIVFAGVMPLYLIFRTKIPQLRNACILFLFTALFVCTLVFGATSGPVTSNFYGGFARVAWGFFIGVFIFTEGIKINALSKIPMAGLLLCVVAISLFPKSDFQGLFWLSCLLFWIPALVMAGSQLQVQQSSALTVLCTYLGRISYPLYCIHWPLLLGFSSILPASEYALPWMLGLMAFSMLLAHLSLVLWDEPARAYLTKKILRPSSK